MRVLSAAATRVTIPLSDHDQTPSASAALSFAQGIGPTSNDPRTVVAGGRAVGATAVGGVDAGAAVPFAVAVAAGDR